MSEHTQALASQHLTVGIDHAVAAAGAGMRRGSSETAPGMVLVPFCYAEAAANILTNPALDPYGKIPEFKYAAVRVEAVEEAMAAE